MVEYIDVGTDTNDCKYFKIQHSKEGAPPAD